MTIFDSIILGVVEGITEYLPVSSTGHLILASRLLGLEVSSFLKSFEISIQLGAIAAVVALYGRKFFLEFSVVKKIAVAFVPTGIFGFLLYSFITSVLFENTVIILLALFWGGIALIVFEWFYREHENTVKEIGDVSYGQAFFIGLTQSISVIPGISRAGATIIGGLCAGLDRKTIVEFSFLLAVPTMLMAAGYDFLKNMDAFAVGDFVLLFVGFITSFVVAMMAIRVFTRYIAHHRFIVFGIYRIALALIFWLVLYT